MLFPYNTDAPIYYRPITTISLILINTLVFVLQCANIEASVPYMLAVGDGMHPIQWLTANFMHADPMHLICNMIFLWSFGLIVEGKLGPIKTLIWYLVIGIVHGATIQILMLWGTPGYCLGASAVIYGFMAMCLIWAPENSLDCVLLISFRPFFFEVPIKIFVGLYVGLDVLVLILLKGQLSTEFLHTAGALLGFVVGIVLLKTNRVDCEYWDLFSVWAGLHRLTPEERQKRENDRPEVKKRKEEEYQKQQILLESEIRRALHAKHVVPAIRLLERMKRSFPNWTLNENELLLYIQLLSDKSHSKEAIAAMQEYLARFHTKAAVVRLRLAKLFFEMENLQAASNVLKEIDSTALDARQLALYRKFQMRTNQNSQAGLYDLAEED